MTFSIVARSADGKSWGVAVASKHLAAGSAVSAAAAGVGAIATQAKVNVSYKRRAIHELGLGLGAREVVALLVAEDSERDHRQVGVVDRDGEAVAHTGSACIAWAGHRVGAGYAIEGNCLAGAQVVDEMEHAWLASDAEAGLHDRLLSALHAGEYAGGDARGKQSAAVLVVTEAGGLGGLDDVAVDLRVDDHSDPVPELQRLLALHLGASPEG